jgi:hypothetical protein
MRAGIDTGPEGHLNEAEARIIKAALAAAGWRPIAQVRDQGRVIDFAFLLPSGERAIVRLAPRVRAKHYCALKTMLADGDFQRAILVCRNRKPDLIDDEIACWPLCSLYQHAAKLARGASA